MVYPIVVYGDSVLRRRSVEIEEPSIEISNLIDDMFSTMYAANGVGLAAPQIGKSIRLIVVDGTSLGDKDTEDMTDFKNSYINPVIVEETGEKWAFEEGCLSIPTVRKEVMRKMRIKIAYRDQNWTQHEKTYEGIKARIIQHEIDHLNGKLFIDYLSPLERRLLKSKLSDISRGKVEVDYPIRTTYSKS